jgi:DNA polymerase
LDFETFFSDDYTLKKMTTEAYIRDPRFEALGCAIRFEHPTLKDTTYWYPNEQAFDDERTEMQMAFDDVDWPNTAVIAHHAHFDGLILSHHYGIKPAFWFDTLSMARLVHGNHLSVSLASLAAHYGLAAKTVPYDLFRGRRWADLDAATRDSLGAGCCHDVDLTYQIFKSLGQGFPVEEYVVIDATVRMFTEPTLVGDQKLFEALRDSEFLSKNQTMYELGVGESDLQSAGKFVALLEAEGVEVAYKDGKNGPIPAIAKTDPFMQELLDDPDPRVAALAQARLDTKSTIDETRAGRLAAMSTRGALAVYLSYCGAHTTRWGGGDRVNFQNLTDRLRHGVTAPEGYDFAQVDQSQGECRLLNYLAGQWDVVERFRRGEDPYLPMASAFFGREITKADRDERQCGKVGELQCGFGSGGPKIVSSARKYGVTMTQDEGMRMRDTYRATHPQVVQLWKTAEIILSELANKISGRLWGPMRITDGKIILPNGAWIDYTTLEWHLDPETGDRYWRLKNRKGWVKMYGAKLVENVIQALSRVVTSQAMIKIRNAGYRVVGMAHDDLWVLLPIGDARGKQFLIETMSMSPSWAPDCPLGAECKVGATYS